MSSGHQFSRRPRMVLSTLLAISACAGFSLNSELLAQTKKEPLTPAVTPTVLLIEADAECTLSLDGEDKGKLLPDQARSFVSTPGDHIVRATSVGNPDISWRQIVAVAAGSQKAVLITMKPVTSQREQSQKDKEQIQALLGQWHSAEQDKSENWYFNDLKVSPAPSGAHGHWEHVYQGRRGTETRCELETDLSIVEGKIVASNFKGRSRDNGRALWTDETNGFISEIRQDSPDAVFISVDMDRTSDPSGAVDCGCHGKTLYKMKR